MTKHRARKQKGTVQLAILIGVVLAAAAILILKAQQSSQAAQARPVPTTTGSGTIAVQVLPPTRAVTSTPATPLLTSTPKAVQPGPPTAPPVEPTAEALDAAALAALSPEEQVDRLLAARQPIFAFFHSNTCKQCIDMTEIVDQVYPAFEGRVHLVDVNVYERRNQNLLRRARLQVIPTLIFIDRSGEGQGYTGVMPADGLRRQLEALAGEP
jgi:thiol-disulfide isomerase/thioredoxin